MAWTVLKSTPYQVINECDNITFQKIIGAATSLMINEAVNAHFMTQMPQ